jgi:hypothetical protein
MLSSAARPSQGLQPYSSPVEQRPRAPSPTHQQRDPGDTHEAIDGR